jgi:predicted transcriptional regulator of viral defense system
MTYRNTQAARMMLSDLATAQGGYFTAKQAAGIGYGKRHLDYHVKAGNIERAGHGLYRLPTIPLSEHDDLIRLTLWSRNRHDEPQAVTSHESALGVHGLGELLPSLIHLTVPPAFRKNPPKGCVLHRARLDVDEIEPREGFRVTTPLRTLLDVAEASSVSCDQLCRIIAQAFDEGLVRKTKLLAALKGHAAEAKLSEATQIVR